MATQDSGLLRPENQAVPNPATVASQPVPPSGAAPNNPSYFHPIATVGPEVEKQVISGQRQFNELSDYEQRMFADQIMRNKGYLTPGNVYSPEALQSMDQQFQDYLKKSDPGMKLPGWLKPLEWAGSKLYWAYSNFVSRPLSAAVLYASQSDRGNRSWNDAWDAAKYTSPGQAATMMFMTDDELRAEGIDPYDMVKSRDAVDKFFSKGWQKWTSGATDFAVSWYADPLVLGFKGVSATRRATYVRPVGPPTAERIDRTMNTGAMTGLLNMVDDFRLRYGVEEGTTRLTRQVPAFRNSNNGSGTSLADALMRANTRDDMDAIMRISMGDHRALLEVDRLSVATAARLERQVARQQSIETSYATRADKTTPDALREKALLDNAATTITGLDRELGTLAHEYSLFGTTDKLYFNAVTTPVGASVRGSFQDFNTAFAKKGDTHRTMFGANVPIGSARMAPITATARLAYNGLYVSPVRLLRSFTDDAPVQYIKIGDPDSHRAVTALLRDASSISPELKAEFTGRYIRATEAERPAILHAMERQVVAGMAHRHGINADTAMSIYRDFYGRRAAVSGGHAQYSTATMADGTPVQVVDRAADGSVAAITPVLSSQMANSWMMMDFKRMDKLLRQQGPVIQRLINQDPNLMDKIRQGRFVAGDTIGGIADTLNKTWKFMQLARIGYGPRAITDEFMGQIAYGGLFPFLARAGKGTINQFFRGAWANKQMDLNRMLASSIDDNIRAQSELVDTLSRKMAINNERQASTNITAAKRRDLRREYNTLQVRHENAMESLAQVRTQRGEVIVRDTMADGVNVGTRSFRGATDQEGVAFQNALRADTSFQNLLGSGVGIMGRSMNPAGAAGWGVVSAAADEAAHTSAWLRAINNQIRVDPLARMRAVGATEDEMRTFLSTAAGREYKNQSPFKAMTNDEIIERIVPHVDRYLPPTMAGRGDIGDILRNRDLTGDELKAAIPKIRERPDVHSEQLDYALGGKGYGGDIARTMESVITGFYKVMNQMPAERLSRNPLFAQLYKSHLKELSKGIPENSFMNAKQYLAYENAARVRALKDVKRLTFNMDYESRIAHSLRFIAPFFGAQMESWTRWARIVADKPQVAVHAVNLYNSPMRSGNATTFDGDPVDGHGYATNKLTGEKYKVDKSDIYLNVSVPKGMMAQLQKIISLNPNADTRDITEMRIPINSLNLVLSGDPVFMPGFGPVVQIPANDFVKGGPLSPFEEGQWQSESFFKELGVLPYGIKGGWWDFINPASGRRLADSEDEYSDKYQKTLMSVMAEEQWKFDEGMRETAPTFKEAMKIARQFTKFEMWSNFVLPFSAGFETPLQFYGDMYRKMMEEDPLRGADNFRDKYGDSMWMFTAQLSKNNAALGANSNAIFSQQAMQGAIDLSSAEFAGDITHILSGPYATGDFSPGAYYYQLNTPIQTGGYEMQREKIGAKAALERAEAQRGWYIYNKLMLPLQSELYRRGLRTFDEKGAEDLQNKKKATALMLSSQTMPDGAPNPYYNELWAKDYTSMDKGKYDRFADNLEKVFGHIIPLGLSEGGRTDLNSLYKYLELRKSVKVELNGRKSQNINAKSNADLKTFMTQNTMALMERDTRFNELHNRYFNRDMGFDMHGFEED